MSTVTPPRIPAQDLLDKPAYRTLGRLPYLNNPNPNNKFLLGLCRSGTTIAAKCLVAPLDEDTYGVHEPSGPAAHTHVDTYSHLPQLPNWPFAGKQTPLSQMFFPAKSKYAHPKRKENPDKTLVVKEVVDRHVMDDLGTIFGDKTNLVNYFRSNPMGLGTGLQNMKQGKPVWILRNPIDIWASIKHQKWHSFDQTLNDTFKPGADMLFKLKKQLGKDHSKHI